jgi:hypothetical protein
VEASLKNAQRHSLQKNITWTKKSKKGRQEWKYSYIIVGLSFKMFKIILKTQFASHVIFFQEIIEYKKCCGH